MKRIALTLAAGTVASPAFAATGPFFSLANTDFVVLIAFLLFLGVLAYFKVPGMLGKMLDKRAADIADELDEARKLREEAQTVLASYERKQAEVVEQAQRIVEHAKRETEEASVLARDSLKASIARRLAAADEQIASARASAVKEVRDTAVTVAVAAASDVIARQMTDARNAELIDSSIEQVKAKLH